MQETKEIREKLLTGERALFGSRNVRIVNCVFDAGESPLKESAFVTLEDSLLRWKYPLWYCHDISVTGTTWFEMARAGVWYTNDITVTDCAIEAPKNFRRCQGVTLRNVSFSNAAETLWSCRDVTLDQVVAKGDYFAMNSEGLVIDGLTLYGNYSFDGCRNVEVRNSRLLSKDAFWNAENVTVRDSFISGEYLGWNSRNVTFINCTIESLQGLCYMEKLKMENCKLINTTFAFEYSQADAEITTRIDSVFNPAGGRISAPAIGRLLINEERVDPAAFTIDCPVIESRGKDMTE